MFTDGTRYETQCAIFGEEYAFSTYSNNKGKYVIGTVRGDNDSRIFLKSLNPLEDHQTKNGWWNVFSISNKPVDRGTYIFTITDVTPDKDGYPIYRCQRVKKINDTDVLNLDILACFNVSGLFSESWAGSLNYLNYRYANEQFEKMKKDGNDIIVSKYDGIDDNINKCYYPAILCGINTVRLFIDGQFDMNNIVKWLNEPSDYEKDRQEKLNSLKGMSKCPHLLKVCEKRGTAPLLNSYTNLEIAGDYWLKYDELICKNIIEPVEGWLNQCEAAAKYWEEFYAAKRASEKAARKAARLAKKEARKKSDS